jgi:hypothetical protein
MAELCTGCGAKLATIQWPDYPPIRQVSNAAQVPAQNSLTTGDWPRALAGIGVRERAGVPTRRSARSSSGAALPDTREFTGCVCPV